MKRMERSDLGITMALGALFLAGLLAWGTVLRRERTDLLNQAQLRLDSVAAQVRDDARCVELFAECSLPGGSEFYLIAPPSSAGTSGDTIAQYRVHTAGPDTVLQRSRFPVDVPASMRIHVRLNFLLPMEVSQSDTGSTGSPGVFADRGLLCAEVAGRRMELVDVARFTRSLRETFTQAGDAGYVALIMDTLSMDTLFRTPTHGPADDAPSVRSSAIVQPNVAPWVAVLHLPGVTVGSPAGNPSLPVDLPGPVRCFGVHVVEEPARVGPGAAVGADATGPGEQHHPRVQHTAHAHLTGIGHAAATGPTRTACAHDGGDR
ncbi:MAG: hypothetical protein IPH53_15940 [Flavobacteriales bacterium]|nr:hypothetical protein [Flavobacteriales bacterium]